MRHCEERSDEAIPDFASRRLLRYARNDGNILADRANVAG